MDRRIVIVAALLSMSGCSVNLLGQDPPRDIDGDGRASFNDLHAPRSEAALPADEPNSRDYGQQLSDHMDLHRGGSQYRDD